MPTGVRIACDVGAARIGIARCDVQGILAVPLDAIAAGPDAMVEIARLVEDTGAVEVLVGLPISLDGTEGPAAARTRSWAQALSSVITVPIRLVDERLTTVEAQRGLHAAGRTTRSSRSVIDSASAAILLQSVLDSRGEDA